MNNLDITYCCVENVITIKNNSDSFTGVLWFSITDCETNLNVTCWWMDLAPYESQTWNLPLNYYEVVKEFDINVMDEQFNLLFKKIDYSILAFGTSPMMKVVSRHTKTYLKANSFLMIIR